MQPSVEVVKWQYADYLIGMTNARVPKENCQHVGDTFLVLLHDPAPQHWYEEEDQSTAFHNTHNLLLQDI